MGARLLRGFAYLWFCLAGGSLLLRLALFWYTDGLGTADLLNLAFGVITLLPGVAAYLLAKRLEGRAATGLPGHGGALEASAAAHGSGVVRLGIGIGVLGTVPLVALCALFFRFPIPLVGNLGGLEAVMPAITVSLPFYGVFLGGFIVQACAGAVAGLLAEHYGYGDRRRTIRLCVLLSLCGAAVGVVGLAVLDLIVGPW